MLQVFELNRCLFDLYQLDRLRMEHTESSIRTEKREIPDSRLHSKPRFSLTKIGLALREKFKGQGFV